MNQRSESWPREEYLPAKFETLRGSEVLRRKVRRAYPAKLLAKGRFPRCTKASPCQSGLCPACVRSLRKSYLRFLHAEKLHLLKWHFLTIFVEGWTKRPGDMSPFGPLRGSREVKTFCQRLSRLKLPGLRIVGSIETFWRTNDNRPTGKPFHVHFLISGPTKDQILSAAEASFKLDPAVPIPIKLIPVPQTWRDFRDVASYTFKQPFWKYSYIGRGPRKRRVFPKRAELAELIANLGPHSWSERLILRGIRADNGKFRLMSEAKPVNSAAHESPRAKQAPDPPWLPPDAWLRLLLMTQLATLLAIKTQNLQLYDRPQPHPTPAVHMCTPAISGKAIDMSAQDTPRNQPPARERVKFHIPSKIRQKRTLPKGYLKLDRIEVSEPDDNFSFVMRFPTVVGPKELAVKRGDLARPSELKRALLNKGAILPDDFAAVAAGMLTDTRAPSVRIVRAGGWYGDTFLSPFGTFGQTAGATNVRLDKSLTKRALCAGTELGHRLISAQPDADCGEFDEGQIV